MLDVAELELLGADDRLPLRTRATDQATCWHRLFYDRFSELRPLYEAFVRRVVAKRFREPFYYQAVPTFRVHLPGNVAVGEFHVDSTYGHPEAELNFWVPLTRAFGTNSIWLESAPGRGDFGSVDVEVGEVLVFDATHLNHGNRVNETGKTRVSFDFRCLRVRDHRETNQRSINTGMPFAPGGYYAAAAMEAMTIREPLQVDQDHNPDG